MVLFYLLVVAIASIFLLFWSTIMTKNTHNHKSKMISVILKTTCTTIGMVLKVGSWIGYSVFFRLLVFFPFFYSQLSMEGTPAATGYSVSYWAYAHSSPLCSNCFGGETGAGGHFRGAVAQTIVYHWCILTFSMCHSFVLSSDLRMGVIIVGVPQTYISYHGCDARWAIVRCGKPCE